MKKTIALAGILRWSAVAGGVVAVTVLLVALSGFFTRKVSMESIAVQAPVPEGATLAVVERVSQPRFESAVGSIKPIHESNVAAKMLARVTEVNVTAGLKVAAGDVLVRLNDEELVARLRQAEAERDAAQAHMQQAEADAARAAQLFPSRAISQAEYEAAKTLVRTTAAQLDRASRAVDEAKVFFEYATIKAPFSGIVVDKLIEPGDTVAPGQTLLTLYDPTQMQLVASVRESLAVKLQVGQQVGARLESMDHQCLATVREVVPRADAMSRSFDVKVSGPCPPGIYSGMFGRLLLPLEDEQILLMPSAAVMRAGQLTFVRLVVSSRVERRYVQLGRVFQDRVEVLSGLNAGDQVIVNRTTGGSQ